ncbi:hypothetical protein KAU45_10595 [bacterium]|nr:hypothetical protein [bacterium]
MPSTGDICQTSGIYRCAKCGNEITMVEGKQFPPCSKCNGTNFVLVRATR